MVNRGATRGSKTLHQKGPLLKKSFITNRLKKAHREGTSDSLKWMKNGFLPVSMERSKGKQSTFFKRRK